MRLTLLLAVISAAACIGYSGQADEPGKGFTDITRGTEESEGEFDRDDPGRLSLIPRHSRKSVFETMECDCHENPPKQM